MDLKDNSTFVFSESKGNWLIVLCDFNKEKFDVLFSNLESYSNELISEKIGCSIENVEELLANYARLLLGNEIKKCVEENGTCFFDAEL